MDAEQLSRELSLKAMTALSNIISDHERGLISKAQAATGCRAVFDSVGGLIGGEVLQLVSEAAKEYRNEGGYEVIMDDFRTKGVMRRCGDNVIHYFTVRSSELITSDDDLAVAREFETAGAGLRSM